MRRLTHKNQQLPKVSLAENPGGQPSPGKLPYVLTVAMVSALVIGLAATALTMEKQRHLERASIASQNIVTLLDQRLDDVFDKVDITLHTIAFHYREHIPPARSGAVSLDSYLKKQQSLLPAISNLRILDRDGIVRYGYESAESVSVSLADRDFFIRAQNEPAAGLIISGPVFGRISQQWMIVLARRLNNADGTFAGVVLATMETTRFDEILSSPSLGAHGAATIRTTDLTLVHRHPLAKNTVGGKEVSKQLQDIVKIQPIGGEYRAVTAVDGIERINAYRRLTHYPFIVLVGLAVDDFLGESRTNSLILVGLAALAILVAALAARRLYRASQEQLASKIHGQRVREQDAILNSSVLGIAVTKDRKYTWCNQRFAQMLGYEQDELIGQPTRIVYADDEGYAAFAREVAPKIKAGQLYKFEHQYKYKDGSFGWFEICGQQMEAQGAEFIWAVADIADRKSAELRLRESEARFRAIFENIDAFSIQGYRPDGTVTYWNPASEKIYGYTPAEAIGRKLLDLIIPADMQAGVKENVVWMFEHQQGIPAGRMQLRHKNGSLVHVYSSHAMVEDVLGNHTLFCLDIDLSEQAKAEDALRERERFIDAVVEHAGHVIVVLDTAGRIVRFNQAAEELSGYTFGELEGQPIWDTLIPLERQDDVRAVFDQMMWDGLAHFHENEWVIKDGSRRMLRWRNTLLRDTTGQATHVVALGYDITQLLLNEQELKNYRDNLEHLVIARTAEAEAARSRTRLIIDSSADGIIELDATGRVLMINPAVTGILGYLPADLIGRNVHDAIHCQRADGRLYPASECVIVDAIIAGKMVRLENEVLWHANGQPVRVAVATHPIWQDNQVAGAVISFFDNTERTMVEQEREQARQAAEQLARIKSEFLANMSHEIRTPLNGVLGLAQIGYRNSVGRDKSQQTFARILDSGKLLLTIINDILDFSKIEAGKMYIESVPFDPGHIADDAISALAGAAESKRIRLIGEKAADLPAACLGDPVRISQVLLNLLSNAVKFTAEGEVRLDVHREDDHLVFQVADTGSGIPPGDIDRLFMPFEQADGSTTRQFGGTGLGLAISRRLAEMMGGSLAATSDIGQGSIFTLRLPLHETDQPVQRGIGPSPSSGKRLSGLRILVAEDNEVNQMVLEDFLKQEGAEIKIVGNGQLAVAAVQDGESFDAVLMDVQMPVMDGLEATRKIVQTSPALPVIGQTAHAMKVEHDRCLAAGMATTITKPIDIDILVAAVLDHVKAPDAKPWMPAMPPATPPIADEAIDWAALTDRYPLRPEFIDRLVTVAIQNHEGDAELLRQLIIAGDLTEIGKMAHALKGIAGNISAPGLQKAAIRVMDAGESEPAELLAQAERLADEAEKMLVALKQKLRGGAAG